MIFPLTSGRGTTKRNLFIQTLALNQARVRSLSKFLFRFLFFSSPFAPLSSATSAHDKLVKHTEKYYIIMSLFLSRSITKAGQFIFHFVGLMRDKIMFEAHATATARRARLSVADGRIISTMPMLSHHCERLLIENCPKNYT